MILSLLFFSSAIMCMTMTLAWQHFGRQRYVLFWAISYGVAVAQWVLNAAAFMLKSYPLMTAASACIIVSASLVTIGARERARIAIRWWQFVLGGGMAIIGCAIVQNMLAVKALQGVIPTAFTCAMMAAAALATWPKGRPLKAPERAFVVVLILFALFEGALTIVASTFPDQRADPSLELYRALLAIGLPSIYVAAGVTAVVLIAGDIATQLRLLVSNDQLTGLLNRRGIDEAGARAIAYARRHNRALAAVICDMDSFKAVNDGHGHIAGDAALRAFSRVLLGAVRQDDICARFGGDEFCVLLVDASEDDAVEVMERVRSAVEQLAIDRMPAGRISASFGVTSLSPGDIALDDLIGRADRALYQSKQAGRNRVSIWRTPEELPVLEQEEPLVSGRAAR